MEQDNRGIVEMLQSPPPTPLLRNTWNLPKILSENIRKNSVNECRSIEPHIPNSIRRFCLYGFSMLLQYKKQKSK